ncbi:MAG TPA: peptide ABC transporter substrate-binding protein [Candidatus Limnocylindrales bacterium]|jgi:peptide/nickel transport system substrate-binding protein
MKNRLFVLLAGASLALAACGPAASQAPSVSPSGPGPSASGPSPSASGGTGEVDLFNTSYAPSEGTPGGQVIFADWQEANLFNPYYFNQVTEANVNTATWDTLVTSTNDFKYAPSQATEIPTLDNGGVTQGEGGDAMTVTWTLRDGLLWSDGEPLTCDDFVFTLGWIMDPATVGLPAGKTGYEDISSIDCSSDTEMVWHFKNIYEGYITLFGTGVLPRHYLEPIPIKDALTGKGYLPDELPNAVVSGPFKFESITPGQELRLARNDNWKNKDGRSAYLDEIVFKWYADADVMIAGYAGDEYDLNTDLNDADLPKLVDIPQDEVLSIDSLTYEFIRPNFSEDTCSPRVTDRGTGCPASDPAIREAVKLAIDKNAINAQLLGGAAALAQTNVSPSAWFYVAPTATDAQDLEGAKAALDAAGWTAGADGIREKGGLKAKVELCTTTRQVRQDTLALVAGWLKEVGIDSVVNAVSPDDIFAAYNESTTDTPCALSRYSYDFAEHAFSVPLDPLSNYPVYHSSQLEPEGGNDGHITDPDVDEALETVKNNVDFAVVKEAMATFQQIYVEKTIEIPLYFRKEVYLHKPSVQNFTGNPTSTGPLWNAADWWIQQ